MREPVDRLRPVPALLLGALVFAAGLALAWARLPEWRARLPEESFFVARFTALARQAGLQLAGGAPVLSLNNNLIEPDGRPDSTPSPTADKAMLWIEAGQSGTLPGGDQAY